MEIKDNQDKGYIAVWLTNEEKNSATTANLHLCC